jgi:hypothetical protein
MNNYKWLMTNDKWQITNDKWQMTNDKWQMTNDKWQMTNDKWQMKNEKWQKVGHPIITCFDSQFCDSYITCGIIRWEILVCPYLHQF